MSFFDGLKKSYAQVEYKEGVATSDFLEATEGLIKLFDVLGSAAFKPVQIDLSGNVEKLRKRLLEKPDQSGTLEELVKNECKEAAGDKKKKKATEGLVWLLRGLDFTAQALRRNQTNASEELSVSFTEAYNNTLRQFHGMLIRPVFALAMKACPYRATFYEKLQGSGDKAKTQDDLEKWLKALESIVAQLQSFLKTGDYTKGL